MFVLYNLNTLPYVKFFPLDKKRAKALLLVIGIVCVPIEATAIGDTRKESTTTPRELASTGQQQQKSKLLVTGIIKDNEGYPLVGVNVREEDTNNGCITDANGHFSLQVKPGSCLIFSYVGFKEKRPRS